MSWLAKKGEGDSEVGRERGEERRGE